VTVVIRSDKMKFYPKNLAIFFFAARKTRCFVCVTQPVQNARASEIRAGQNQDRRTGRVRLSRRQSFGANVLRGGRHRRGFRKIGPENFGKSLNPIVSAIKRV